MPIQRLCGQLLVCGFAGPELDGALERALREQRRAGVILFRRNIESLAQVHALNARIAAAAAETPPFISVDQEGGRVERLKAPFPELPPMRELAQNGSDADIQNAGLAVGRALRALGFNLDFAPVLDVDSNPDNPVIGDRAFSSDPAVVARLAGAFAQGLADAAVLSCGKHFPGHGDTEKDSHLDLPIVRHDAARLRSIEIPPFAALARSLPTMMSAHVVYEGLDPGVPATLSRHIATELLREDLGFDGVLFSDDLEMRALADRYSVEDSAIGAIAAGCDVLLVCKESELADRAHEALCKEAEKSAAFRTRCEEAAARSRAARVSCPPGAVGAREISGVLAGLRRG